MANDYALRSIQQTLNLAVPGKVPISDKQPVFLLAAYFCADAYPARWIKNWIL